MPELPEVETVRRGLAKLIVGRRVERIEILNPKSFDGSKADVKKFLLGSEIIGARRRGKMLIIDLSTNYSLAIHLKMTGQLVVRAENFQPRGQLNADSRENWGAGHPTNSFVAELPDRSTRVIFNLSGKVLTDEKTKISDSAQSENDSIPAKLFFNDQRKFGWIRLLKTADVAQMEFVKKLGPEPLDENPPLEQFLKNIRRHQNSAVKAAILDQSVVAGIGNIYADESLWAARVHPAARVKNLSDRKLEKILLSAIAVMKKSIASGGSTMRNYIRADGSKGDYLEKFAKVFRRDGRPCPRCGRVIQKIRVAGRGTHICPNCQKMPGEKSK